MSDLARYHRQMLLPGIGEAGQRRLADAHALLVGCGALGTVIADALVRAGIGTLTIIDRDFVEVTNLQRQILFTEADVASGTPKALAAKQRLERINSQVRIQAIVDDFNARNAERCAEGADLILDGLDNFETRYLLNDLAVSRCVPYVYGGAVGTTGMSLTILPRRDANEAGSQLIRWTDEQSTPCLRCVFPEAPPPGASPTCDTAGVLGSVVMQVAAHQATQAVKLIVGDIDAVDRQMLSIDVWANEQRRFDVSGAGNDACPCCGQRDFIHLAGDGASGATSLCGRNAVQISPVGAGASVDLAVLAARLSPHGSFHSNEFLMRGELSDEPGENGGSIELTLFANGRAIIRGTTDIENARSIYARYIGS